MRGMNMLQMLGGVALAGVVAAGTTAFTASAGLVTTGVKLPMMGGGAQVTVTGAARLRVASFHFGAALPNKITGIELTIDDGSNVALGATSTVQAAFTGVAAGSAPATTVLFPCTQGAGQLWNCDFGTPDTNYYSAVTVVDVLVAPVAA